MALDLPVVPPVAPMLATLARELPVRDDVIYEPKWDGFRCLVFRSGGSIELTSRNERPLTRYFPEILDPLLASLPDRCVLDGELVIAGAEGLDFEALLERIHPADSRVQRLAAATPASYVAFDLLALGSEDLRAEPFASRRQELERALATASPPVYLTPATTDPARATEWFHQFEGAGLDGVIVKPAADPYREGTRSLIKVKHERTADCVVAGFRRHKDGNGVGSLLLGLYDDNGQLHHVGVASGFSAARRRDLAGELEPHRAEAGDAHPWIDGTGTAAPPGRRPGGPTRWNASKDLSWEPVRPELVAEVAYDHMQGDRFRHATKFRRWRTDRDPTSCTYDQLERPPPEELARVFGAGSE